MQKNYKKLYHEAERNRRLTNEEASGYLDSLKESRKRVRELENIICGLRYQVTLIRQVLTLDAREQ